MNVIINIIYEYMSVNLIFKCIIKKERNKILLKNK